MLLKARRKIEHRTIETNQYGKFFIGITESMCDDCAILIQANISFLKKLEDCRDVHHESA